MNDRDKIVYIVDDDAAVRDALHLLIETAGLSGRCFASAESFLQHYDPALPACLLLDVRMPEMNGIDLQQRLKEQNIELPVIVISGHADVPMAVEMMRHGAMDFFQKPFDNDVLLERVHECLQQCIEQYSENERIRMVEAQLATLTSREQEVLEGVVAGMSSKVIADNLGISVKTVDVHRSRIMEKMAVRNIAELTRKVMSVKAISV